MSINRRFTFVATLTALLTAGCVTQPPSTGRPTDDPFVYEAKKSVLYFAGEVEGYTAAGVDTSYGQPIPVSACGYLGGMGSMFLFARYNDVSISDLRGLYDDPVTNHAVNQVLLRAINQPAYQTVDYQVDAMTEFARQIGRDCGAGRLRF